MKLELNFQDILPEYIPEYTDGSVFQVTFDKLNKAAQVAVIAVGQGTFFGSKQQTSEIVYAPK